MNELAKGKITDGAITLTPNASSGIEISGNGFKIKNGGFTITSTNGAKIKTIKVKQSATNRELKFNPPGTKSSTSSDFTFEYSYTNLPDKIDVTGPSSSLTISDIEIEYETTGSTTPATDLTATYAKGTLSVVANEVAFTTPILTVKAGKPHWKKVLTTA